MMKTVDIRRAINKTFTKKLTRLELGYTIDKQRNVSFWTIKIGRFNSIKDMYIELEVSPLMGDILEQFNEGIVLHVKNERLLKRSR